MKLLPVEYLGYTAMDKRFSSPMLPWVITEIRRRGTIDKICVGVEDGTLQAYDTNFEQQFTHNVEHMVRFSRATTDGRSFMYLLRDPTNPLLYCHLFRATRNEDVSELFKQMREQGGVAGQQVAGSTPVTGVAKQCTLPGRSISSAANLTSLCADISPSSSHFFEVLYIGKIKVSHRKVPDTFIDDALCKFQAHEQQKLKEKSTHQSQTTRGCVPDDRRGSVDSTTSDTGSVESLPSHTLNNPTLISPLTPLDPSKSFASHADSEQYAALCIPPIDSAIVAKRAIYAKSERTRTISEGSESGIKIQRTRTSTDMSDYATGDDEKNVPEPQSYTSLEKNCNLEKNISRSFENVQTLGQTNPSLDKNKNVLIGNNAQLATTIGGRKCGSTEALPTGSADKQQDAAMKNVNEQPDHFSRTRSSSIGNGSVLKRQDSSEHNRTMVFQVGRTDLRLISPDRKQVLVHKQLKDVVSCIQGIKNTEHFGFICREANIEFFMGYVFKCQSAAVSVDVVQAITQAYQATNEAHKHRERPVIMSCDHCPMVWYHRLCTEVENQSDRKTQAIIFRRISNLDEEEQNVILTKFRGAETDSIREQNEFLMMLLRAHCEAKQNRHMHDTAENRSEFLNQYLGGSTIFMKAKRSLTNSFDHLLKRKGSRDDFGPNLSLPLSRENSPHPQSLEVPSSDFIPDAPRSRTSTLSSTNGDDRPPTLRVSPDHSSGKEDKLKSPMMDIFFKVGSSPKSENSSDSRNQSTSWRQEMFNRVVTPSKTDSAKHTRRKRDKEELRMLWKKAINQALLLIRMEKENARLRARQEESAVKRIKLEYDEICPCQRELMDVWELLVSKESRISTKCDTQMLLQAIRQGVPRSKRGEVWHFLAEQFCMKQPPIDTTNFPNYNTPYENLLKQLTSHQHAILIDLGRTFPNHTYFSSPLGPGQLALFNLLKAYSLLDPEVGYCQGLSFVAGVLLLHMSEDEAFFLLRHLMFRRGLRKQYLPDMVALQVHLYQLSRLLHDQIPELYEHFNKHEVVPTLYAAPWVLTIFASQFPLGFVTRVFDLLFLESPDVIFRAAIALLNHHKEGLLMCDSFEEIMDFLKNTVPSIDKKTFEKVLKQVFMSDITKQLNEYQVEYHVLQEEMASVRPQLDSLEKMEHQNKTLREQNKALMDQLELALSNAQRLETTRTVHLSTMNRLESQSRSLEVTVNTLGNFINNLIEKKLDIEIPGDVRRIVSQIALSEQRRNNAAMSKANVPTMRRLEPQKTMVKSLSMGKLGLNFNKSKDEMVARSHSVNTGLGNILAQNLKQSEEVDRQNTLLNNINANLNKIEDKGHRGIPLRVIEDNSTYEPVSKQVSNKQTPPHPLKTTLSQPALGSKSGFFANSHNHIQQQRMNSLALKQGLTTDTKTNLIQNMTDHSNKIITDVSNKPQLYQNQNQFTESLTSKLESTLALTNNSNNNNNEKSVSLPLDVHSIYKHDEFRTENPYEIHKDVTLDSGISTPMSPIKENTISEIPLYDSDVNFTFNGTSQLKSIKPVPKVVKTQQ